VADDEDSGLPIPPGTMTVVGALIKAAGDNPSVKAAGGELGKTAHTIAKTINIALLPLAAINFGYDKAREYFETRFSSDLEEKLRDVAQDEIIQPKPSLAGPILQGLAFSHDESTLKDMYLHLLASAMTKKEASRAHPAFAEIIKQLTAEEAASLLGALSPPDSKAIVQVRLQSGGPGGGYRILLNHLMAVTDVTTRNPIEVPNLPEMVDNWIRLGLVAVSYTEWQLSSPGFNPYAWADQRPEVQRLRTAYAQPVSAGTEAGTVQPKGKAVVATPGIFRLTAFGTAFANTVGVQKMFHEALARDDKAQGPAV
jgi:Abortive infection alpha